MIALSITVLMVLLPCSINQFYNFRKYCKPKLYCVYKLPVLLLNLFAHETLFCQTNSNEILVPHNVLVAFCTKYTSK